MLERIFLYSCHVYRFLETLITASTGRGLTDNRIHGPWHPVQAE